KPSRNAWMTTFWLFVSLRKAAALCSASRRRRSSELKTTQWISTSRPRVSCRRVPPQPISISSQCAPRQSTRSGRPAARSRFKLRMALGFAAQAAADDARTRLGISPADQFRSVIPNLPGRMALRVHIVQRLFVLECVHRRPEAVVFVRQELLLFDQSLERLVEQLLAILYVVEYFSTENEVTSVDPDIGAVHIFNGLDDASGTQRNEVAAEVRADTEKARKFLLAFEAIDLLRQLQVRQAIAVIGEERLFAFEIFPNRQEPLADVGINARVSERDVPVLDVTVEKPQIFAAAR